MGSFFETLVVLSVLVCLAIMVRLINAIRLLNERVSILNESAAEMRKVLKLTDAKAASKRPQPALNPRDDPSLSDGEKTTHVIEDPDLEDIFAQLDAESEKLKKAMGADFQMRKPARKAPPPAKEAFAESKDPLRRMARK